jgi:hypothetical protein
MLPECLEQSNRHRLMPGLRTRRPRKSIASLRTTGVLQGKGVCVAWGGTHEVSLFRAARPHVF